MSERASTARTTRWREASVETWLAGKTSAELAFAESAGRVYYPETLRKRRGAKREEVEVHFRVPTTSERARARVEAIRWAAALLRQVGQKELGETIRGAKMTADLPTLEDIAGRIGAAYWQNLDSVSLLSVCVFDAEKDGTFTRHMLPEVIDDHYEAATLYDAYARLDWYAAQESPAVEAIDKDAATTLLLTLSERRSLGPLVACAPSLQAHCVTSMAIQLSSCPTCRSSWASTVSSTPAT